MKKLIPIIFILAILALIAQIIIQSFIRSHEINYSIIDGSQEYLINEKMNIEEKKHIYGFKVSDKNTNNLFYFNFIHNYNKQDSVIKEIKYLEDDNLSCIFPIYKKNLYGNLFCNYNGFQVSNSYLRQINNLSLDKFILKLKNDGYKFAEWEKVQTNPGVAEGTYNIYEDNLPSDIIFSMWFYHGFYRITNGEIEKFDFLNNDKYENNMSYIVDNYMFVVNTDDVGTSGYSNYYIFDIAGGTKMKYDFDEQLSENMYFNGIYNNKLYYTDLTKKKQFSLQPKHNIISEVGNVDLGFKTVKNGKLVDISAKDFLEEKVYFSKKISNSKLVELYNAKEIKKDGDWYYFINNEGNFYKVNIYDLEHPILLFKFDFISEWVVKDGNIMIVSNDMLYFYNDDSGLLPILQNNELKYNYKNICNFVIK